MKLVYLLIALFVIVIMIVYDHHVSKRNEKWYAARRKKFSSREISDQDTWYKTYIAPFSISPQSAMELADTLAEILHIHGTQLRATDSFHKEFLFDEAIEKHIKYDDDEMDYFFEYGIPDLLNKYARPEPTRHEWSTMTTLGDLMKYFDKVLDRHGENPA